MHASAAHPSESLTRSRLESRFWEAANILRGSPVSRTHWKSYTLPLLFLKRICDVLDHEHARMVDEYGDDFAEEEHRSQVREGCVVSLDEIEAEGGTLNISRYVLLPIGADIPPLPEAWPTSRRRLPAAARPRTGCGARRSKAGG